MIETLREKNMESTGKSSPIRMTLLVHTIPFFSKHQRSIVQTIPIHGQFLKSNCQGNFNS